MSKQLPYFKFVVNDWITGDITLEPYYMQGIFISLCAFYWSKDCSVTIETIRKRFRGDTDAITDLLELGIIKERDGYCVINFLDEQLESKEVQRITNRGNGSKGGRPKKTEEKPNRLFFGNRNETETKANENQNETNIEERKGKERIEEKRKEEIPPTPVEIENSGISIFNHSEIVQFVNKTFGKEFTEQNLSRFQRDLINNLITVNKYSKDQVLYAWANILRDKFHREKKFNTITFSYLAEPKTIERYIFWKDENQNTQSNGTQNSTAAGQSNFKGPTMGQRLDEAKRQAKERRAQQGGGSSFSSGDEFTNYQDVG